MNSNTIKFRASDKIARDRIIRRGMWNIADVPMVVSRWTPIKEDAQLVFKSVPMWIKIQNIPPEMFTRKGINFLASSVGEPKKLHFDTEICNSFEEAKVFVEADLSKSLPKTYRFKSELGIDATVDYVYPWLPPRCTTCSKWGHLDKTCQEKLKEPEATKKSDEKFTQPIIELSEGLSKKVDSEVELPKTDQLINDSTVKLPETEPLAAFEKPVGDISEGFNSADLSNASYQNRVIQKESSSITGEVTLGIASSLPQENDIDKHGITKGTNSENSQIEKSSDFTISQENFENSSNAELWSPASPVNPSKRKVGTAAEENPMNISPSRFAVLEECLDPEESESSREIVGNVEAEEEGEILESTKPTSDIAARIPLPRSSKNSRKFSPKNTTQLPKGKHSITSNKRGNRKRT